MWKTNTTGKPHYEQMELFPNIKINFIHTPTEEEIENSIRQVVAEKFHEMEGHLYQEVIVAAITAGIMEMRKYDGT